MAQLNLPSAKNAKTVKEVIDIVEKMRKELEFALTALDIDNMNSSYVAVVESGSNSNGFYRKFSDGMMECWHSSVDLNSDHTWNQSAVGGSTYFYIFTSWAYPQPFLPGQHINLMASGDIGGAAPETHTAFHVDHTHCQVESGMFGADPKSFGGNVSRTWFARGRWK